LDFSVSKSKNPFVYGHFRKIHRAKTLQNTAFRFLISIVSASLPVKNAKFPIVIGTFLRNCLKISISVFRLETGWKQKNFFFTNVYSQIIAYIFAENCIYNRQRYSQKIC